MHNDSSGFVEDQNLFVLEEDFERNGFTPQLERFGFRDVHRDLIAGLDLLTRSHDLIVEAYPSELDEALQGRPRHISLTIDEKNVQPLRLFTGCDHKLGNHVCGTRY
jgi:hypothetical protein